VKKAEISQDVQIPTKLDCFNSMPVIKISCGENHSMCEVELERGETMVMGWGMFKNGQLGIGEIKQ
jgi:alpha-tubulin suppressor-like RCC1 family protein